MLFRSAFLVALAACTPTTGNSQESARSGDPASDLDGLIPVELATVGMDAIQRTPVVLLREPASGRIVPILVGVSEAQAILRSLLGAEMPRPMTHDLLASVLDALNAHVEEVVVHELRGSTFIGRIRLTLNDGAETREIDSRPSDALALAVRVDAPIRVAGALLADPPEYDFLAPEAGEQVVRILGTTVVTPTASLRQRHGLPDRPGLVVVGTSGEAAEKGLRRGDLIVEVDGVAPHEPMDFLQRVLAARDAVRVRFWRDGSTHDVELTPTAPPPTPTPRRQPGQIET